MSILASPVVPAAARITTTTVRGVTLTANQHLRASASAKAASRASLRTGDDLMTTGRVQGTWIELAHGTKRTKGWVPTKAVAPISPSSDAWRVGPAAPPTSTAMLTQPTAAAPRLLTVPAGREVRMNGRYRKGWTQVTYANKTGWVQLSLLGPVTSTHLGLRTLKSAITLRAKHSTGAAKLASLRAADDVFVTRALFGTWRKVEYGKTIGWVPVKFLTGITPTLVKEQAGTATFPGATTLRALPHAKDTAKGKVSAGTATQLSGRSYQGWLEVYYTAATGPIGGWVLAGQVAPSTNPGWSGARTLTSSQALLKSHGSPSGRLTTLAADTDVYATGRAYATWAEVKDGTRIGWVRRDQLAGMQPVTTDLQVGPAAATTALSLLAQAHPLAPATVKVPQGGALWLNGRSHKGWLQASYTAVTGGTSISGWVREHQVGPRAGTSWGGVRVLPTAQPLRASHRSSAAPLATVPAGADVLATRRLYGQWAEVTHAGKTGWVLQAEAPAMVSITTELQAGPVDAGSALSLLTDPFPGSPAKASIPKGGDLSLSGRSHNGWLQASYAAPAGWITGWARENQVVPRPSTSWTYVRVMVSEQVLWASHAESSAARATVPNGADVLGKGRLYGKWVEVDYAGTTGWIPQAATVAMQTTVDELLKSGAAVAVSATVLRAQPNAGTEAKAEVPAGGALRLTGTVHKDWVQAYHGSVHGWLPERLLAPVPSTDFTGVRRTASSQVLRARPRALSGALATIDAGRDVILTGAVIARWAEVKHGDKAGWIPQQHLSRLALVENPAATGPAVVAADLPLLAYPVAGTATVTTVPAKATVLATGRYHGSHAEMTYGGTTGWGPKASMSLSAQPTILTVKSVLAPGVSGATTTLDELVARRFSPATSPEVYDQVRQAGWQAWLTEQMSLPEDADGDLITRMTRFMPTSTMTYPQIRGVLDKLPEDQRDPGEITHGLNQRAGAVLLRQLFGRRMLHETMFEFWMDHFSIPYRADQVHAAAFGIDVALRKVVLTSFPQVLRTMYQQLAIYYVLDNRQNRRNAINENLARETLELYTLGVGNYTEKDVEQLAILFTGWTASEDGNYALEFRDRYHHYTPASLAILGKSFRNATEAEARASHAQLIDLLATHPATIQLVCRKLAARFVAEAPPQALVDRLVSVHRSTGGNIQTMLWTIVESAEFRASAGARWKRPGEYIQSMHRSMQPTWDRDRVPPQYGPLSPFLSSYQYYLGVAGHRTRYWPAPDGYPDRDDYWMGSSAVMQCLKLATTGRPSDRELVAGGTWDQVLPVDPSYTEQVNAGSICRAMTGYTPNAATRDAVAAALADTSLEWTARVQNGVRMAMTSPLAFLR